MTCYQISMAGLNVSFQHQCLIGRGQDCDLRLLGDAAVSRHHARITVCAFGVVVEDLESRNGTWLDGRRLRGSQLVIGSHQLRIGRSTLELTPPQVFKPVVKTGRGDRTTPREPCSAVSSAARLLESGA